MHLGVNTLFHVPRDIGGTETYLREILLALVKEYPDLELTLFTHSDNDALMREWLSSHPRAVFSRLPLRARIRPLRIVAEQCLLPWYVRKSAVDLLWSPGYTAPFTVNCPQVVTVHDLQYKRYPQDMKWLERIALDLLVKSACKRCEAVITVSEFSRREVVDCGFAVPNKVHAVLEGVSTLFSEPNAGDGGSDALTTMVPPDEPFILCVAHTYPHKNVDLLIDAFADIQEAIAHNLVIVGKPRLGEPRVEQSIRRMQNTHRLYRLKRGVTPAYLKWLYQQADIFVLPSGYEGFGLPVLEAMMAGTMVISSPEASLPEVGGEHALYCRDLTRSGLAGQMMTALQMDNEMKTERCRKAQAWAQSFTWERSARETMSVFRSCIENKNDFPRR